MEKTKRLDKKVIICIGDTLLDNYYFVKSDRISPEYPVPILKSTSLKPDKVLCGGASNVIYQLKYMDVETYLVSILDEETACFLKDCGINVDYSVIKNCLVPRKNRFYDENFPFPRWDIEKENYGLENITSIQKSLLKQLQEIKEPDIIIFSDYNKGVFVNNPYIPEMLNLGKTTIVDPKDDYKKWLGCSVFKPNLKEAKQFTGKINEKEMIGILKDYLKCDIVLTKSGEGVWLNDILFENKDKVDAKSVIGAGDCFVAILAYMIANDIPLEIAVKLADSSGKKYVQNRFNQPLSYADLIGKITKPEYLENRGFKLVLTNGCFDLCHSSHVNLLKFAKKQGDKLVVALNSDASIKRLKGENRPINCLKDRMEMLKSFDFVDYVVSFSDDTPENIIKIIKPDIIVKGGDYTKEQVIGHNLVKEVIIFPYEQGNSTTNIIKKIGSSFNF